MEKLLKAAKSFKHHSNLGSRDIRGIIWREAGQKGMWKGVRATGKNSAEHKFTQHTSEQELTAHGLRRHHQQDRQKTRGGPLGPQPLAIAP